MPERRNSVVTWPNHELRVLERAASVLCLSFSLSLPNRLLSNVFTNLPVSGAVRG